MGLSQHPCGAIELAAMQALRVSLVPGVGVGDLLTYVNAEIDPNTYSSASQFKRDYAYVSFLRKWKGFKHVSIDPGRTALATWLKAEELCFKTNRRLESEASTGCYSVAPVIISDAQRKIARILGPVNIEAISELCRFGNGATFDLRRGSTHADKSRRPSITFDAIPWACRILKGDDYLGSLVGPLHDLRIVSANRMVMVPKTVKTHRPIAAEPTLNSYIQQGIGRYIRSRLRHVGVDLNDQTINQSLAGIAQDWGLATLDLSSASDTLCANLVRLLLPREWWELLDETRCHFTQLKGRRFAVSKFSSMGNAYTFELETLIFYALISSAGGAGVFSVYGDDLVVHQDDYQPTLEVLEWGGFVLNESKSFSVGSRFYESCGKHYFDRGEVTPCYQKDVCSRPHDYVRLHNRLVRAGIRLDLREEFREAASIVREGCRYRFGKSCPGVGPLVEYDEYFIKENYSWPDDLVGRVRIRSAITVPHNVLHVEEWQHTAYFGRKLRNSAFLNPDPKGQCSDTAGSKLFVTEKYHWRSATLG